jgi:predicted alpha/beta-hydrolase family hydrolase
MDAVGRFCEQARSEMRESRTAQPKAASTTQPVSIDVGKAGRVSALLQKPVRPKACLILAHGAGAGMQHPYLAALADAMADLGIASLRYQFPYMENHSKRPDAPAICQATVRAAAVLAHELMPSLALFAAGKSFGGRMTSQAQAASPLAHVLGIAFFGYPLHPPKQPADSRAEHLMRIKIPLLFLQGTRDAFAERSWLEPVVAKVGPSATLTWVEDADHSFHVPARSGRTDDQVRAEMLDALVRWMELVIRGGSAKAAR